MTLAPPSTRPQPGEYAPYYDKYVAQVPDNSILVTLEDQRRSMLILLTGRPEADGDLRYAPDKWSVKEVLGHICDAERVFAYRALRISRGDKTPLASFDENEFARNSPLSRRPLSDSIEDYIAVRRATVSLFRNLDEAAWARRGVASNHEVSVRALAYMIAGHELHHRKMLEEKYLK
ncbi:MAG: DinB family protein [Terriglobales bacterium]